MGQTVIACPMQAIMTQYNAVKGEQDGYQV